MLQPVKAKALCVPFCVIWKTRAGIYTLTTDTIVFVTADIVSLTAQGVGGGIAATAAGNHKNPEMGGRIMLGGIVFQMLAITVYMGLAIEFIYRFWHNKPFEGRDCAPVSGRTALTRNIKYMLVGSALSSLMIYVRCVQQVQASLSEPELILESRSVYRTIELVDGWNGRIIQTELYFDVMDGAMIVASMYCLNIFHPGALLGSSDAPAAEVVIFGSSADFAEKANAVGGLYSCGAQEHNTDECSKV